jgi:hypothetical protein
MSNAYDAIMGVNGPIEMVNGPINMVGVPAIQGASPSAPNYSEGEWRTRHTIDVGVGDEATLVAPGAEQVYNLQLGNPFTPLRLMVGSSIAPFFVLTGVKIGSTDFIDGSGVSCEAFTEVATSLGRDIQNIDWGTIQLSQPAIFRVRNIGAVARSFRLQLRGHRLS